MTRAILIATLVIDCLAILVSFYAMGSVKGWWK